MWNCGFELRERELAEVEVDGRKRRVVKCDVLLDLQAQAARPHVLRDRLVEREVRGGVRIIGVEQREMDLERDAADAQFLQPVERLVDDGHRLGRQQTGAAITVRGEHVRSEHGRGARRLRLRINRRLPAIELR